jgi:hypothetical protein
MANELFCNRLSNAACTPKPLLRPRLQNIAQPCFPLSKLYLSIMELTYIQDLAIQAKVASDIGANLFDKVFFPGEVRRNGRPAFVRLREK